MQCILNCELHTKCFRSSKNNRSGMIIRVYISILISGSGDVSERSSLLCIPGLFFSSSMQQDTHETLVKMLQVSYNIFIFSQVDDLNLSQPLSQPPSQLTTSTIKNNLYGPFKITYKCRACNKKIINTDSFLDIGINPVDGVDVFVASLTDTLSKYCNNCSGDTIHTTIKDI